MLLIAVALLAVLLVRPLGGRLAALGEVRLAGSALVVAALAAQVVALGLFVEAPRPLLVTLHGASYVLAAVFVWRNRALPGTGLVALGTLLNSVALAVNGGTMPADPDAVRRAGMAPVEQGYTNSEVLAHPHLARLGDVFATPSLLPGRNVYSVGDLLVLAAVVWAVHRTCGTALGRLPGRVLARLPRRLPRATGLAERPSRRQRGVAPARSSSQRGTASAGIGRLSR